MGEWMRCCRGAIWLSFAATPAPTSSGLRGIAPNPKAGVINHAPTTGVAPFLCHLRLGISGIMDRHLFFTFLAEGRAALCYTERNRM